MISNFLTIIYQAFCEPRDLYESVAVGWPRQQRHFAYAMFIVFLVSVVKTLSLGFDGHITAWTILWVLFSALVGLFIWLLVSLSFACMAFSLRSNAKLITLLILTGYASIPWILVFPLHTIASHIPYIGSVVYLLGMLVLLGWIFTLFIMALQVTYHLKPSQAIIMSMMPVLLLVLMQAWVAESVIGLFGFLSSL